MSGLYEVDCNGCGRRYETSVEQARKQRVLRCPCGQFVRLDRALQETPAESAAPSRVELARAVGDQVEVMGASASIGAGRDRSPEPSMFNEARASSPVPRGTLSSLSQAQWKAPSATSADKPLWYVDLGGSETVEMTIEQLIIARRSGKLGEGALVWREGMPRWRSVGTLIPATSLTGRPTPTPPAPNHPPTPRAPSQPTLAATVQRARAPSEPPEGVAPSLGSYERPLATLEFALESPEDARVTGASARSTLSSVARAPTPLPPPRLPTPVPRQAAPAPSAVSATVAPSAPPSPTPRPSPLSEAQGPLPAVAQMPVLAAAQVPVPAAVVQAQAESLVRNLLGDRPRWVSACIALLVCVTASGSGAFLVRSLKQRRQPLALTSSIAAQATPSVRSPNGEVEPPQKTPTRQPQVINLESLSVERTVRRAPARPNPAPVPKPLSTPETELSLDDTDGTPGEPAVSPPSSVQKPKNIELPAAARANPYTTGSVAEGTPKKTPIGGDTPGF